MALKISTESGTFDLPQDFSIEVEDTSPIFNERGSQTVAATIPTTKNNQRLKGYLHRADNDRSPNENSRVVISDGVYRRVGKMNVTKASRSGGIVSNIGFDESELYSSFNAVQLKSLNNLPVFRPTNLDELISHLNNVMTETATGEPYHVFQVCVSLPSKTENEVESFYPEYLNKMKVLESGGYALDSAARTETYLLDNDAVVTSLPKGYGITAFLKVSWILEKIFSNYGYTVVENPFLNHPQLSRLVVLNNMADSIVKGSLSYADLLPTCTINEFLQALYCRFGMMYFVDSKFKKVRCRLIKDILSSPASEDYSLLKASDPIMNFSEAKQLKLMAGTSIVGAASVTTTAPTADSLDKLLDKYDHIVSSSTSGYITYYPPSGTYWKRGIATGTNRVLSSDFFPWDKGGSLSYEEISSIDECLPMKAQGPDDGLHCPGYLVGKQHRYTHVLSADVKLDSKDQNNSTPLCFCFKMPVDAYTYPFGSPRCYTPSSQPIVESGHTFDISLTFVGDNGLFNRFWKEYDAILRYANHTFETELHLDHNQLLNVDISNPISIDGQRLLIDTCRYLLPLVNSKPATVNFRTLRLLHPYDLKEQQVIISDQQLYKWKFFSNKGSIMDSKKRAYLSSLQATAGYRINRAEDVRVSENQVTDEEIPFTIPSKYDYDNKVSIFFRSVHYSYNLYFYSQRWNPNGYWEAEVRSNSPQSGEIDYNTYLNAVGIND